MALRASLEPCRYAGDVVDEAELEWGAVKLDQVRACTKRSRLRREQRHGLLPARWLGTPRGSATIHGSARRSPRRPSRGARQGLHQRQPLPRSTSYCIRGRVVRGIDDVLRDADALGTYNRAELSCRTRESLDRGACTGLRASMRAHSDDAAVCGAKESQSSKRRRDAWCDLVLGPLVLPRCIRVRHDECRQNRTGTATTNRC